MKELTIEEKAKHYDESIETARKINSGEGIPAPPDWTICEYIFPELKESGDERIRKALIRFHKSTIDIDGIKGDEIVAWLEKQGDKDKLIKELGEYKVKYTQEVLGKFMSKDDERLRKTTIEFLKEFADKGYENAVECIGWLENPGFEPNWCRHKVDLSNCSEEYRKAYYDGWNNCNMQHSQCELDKSDVLKCLINGMKFYYEGNEEATWGTEKFSMKVKDILSWLEKQGEKPRYSIGDVLCDKSCATLNKDAQPNYEIVDIRNGLYICDKGYIPISQQDEYELVAKKIEQKVPIVDFKAKDWYVSKVDGKIYNAKYMEKTTTNLARKLEIEKAAMSVTGIINQEEWFIKGAEWADKNPSYISSEKQGEQKHNWRK